MHELSTNAAKYGALSVPTGCIEVRWHILREPSQPPLLSIEWRERNGPPVSIPENRGFGSRFIESSVASELRGTARLDFDAAGLCCTMRIPIAPETLDVEGGTR
jgi:two-component sensor histidine kinase